ncbi:uncharacterized protein LY89DRAFT_678976 [Mollisia scopiformis]|uniref:Uncharacterized protein n=1 Tax=Mollisia scopiformis TaxID=149040 RepID=A0A132B1F4_MOLSC|nr:uncharacterized protein LY89DRAFT_678976 [Mollisia scopiformis]KUJ06206.1 hypothetical protein LY89DRAFT_678976 [Mollisia scopiformis]
MNRSRLPQFVLEGGKFHLADALFNSFKFKIRCPNCVGNPLKPRFIKDEAEQEEYAALQGYCNLGTTHTTPASSLGSQTLPRKRKADEELPFLDKTTRHSQAQERRESSGPNTSSLQSTLQHLESMIEMSKTWQEQHRMLTIFLTSSSPPQPTPSCETPSWSSPSLAPKHIFSSDASIPCTYPEDELSSSPPNPSSDSTKPINVDLSSSMPKPEPQSKSTSPVKVYVRSAVFKRSYDPAPPTDIPSSSPVSPPPDRPFDPINRARELVQQFKQARADPATATEKRRAIRQQARTDGVYSNFQALLNQSAPNPELKCSERT